MTSVLLLTPDRGLPVDAVEPRRARLRDRIAARLRAHALDRALAAGVPPERSAALSLRARRLIDPAVAPALARGVRQVLSDAHLSVAPRGRVAARTQAVRTLAEDLEDIADRLVAPRPLAVAGVAQVRILLTDGAGPLYARSAREDLSSTLRRARAALELF